MELLTSIDLDKAAALLKTIAHPTRLAIVNHLAIHPALSVGELVELLAVDQPLVSHHLGNMKIRGILSSNKVGKTVKYSLKETHLIQLFDCIKQCNCHF